MSCVFTKKIEAVFRGDREYYHSTSLYSDCIEMLSQYYGTSCFTDIKIEFRSPIIREPILQLFENKKPERSAHHKAVFQLRLDEVVCFCVISEDSSPIIHRETYDEPTPDGYDPNALSVFYEYSPHDGVLTPIDICTSLGVHLANLIQCPQKGQKWMLAQLKLCRVLNEEKECKYAVELKSEILNKILIFNLLQDGSEIGALIFTLAEISIDP